MERDDDAVARFVERFAAVLTEAGFPRMPARVFVTLLCADSGAATAAELRDRLQVSAGAVSGAVRYLAQVELLDREHRPGSRQERYRVRDDVWQEATLRRDRLFGRLEGALREGTATLGAATPAGQRLARTGAFFAFLREQLPALYEEWQRRCVTPGPPE